MDTPSSQYEKAYLVALAAALRAEHGASELTFEELAERSGVSKSSLLRFEKGTRDPTIGSLFKIARALGVTPAKLAVDAEERMNRPRPSNEVGRTTDEQQALERMVEKATSKRRRRPQP